ncbi:hypothetical protein Ahy_A02g004958 [Arachis hypogaea]|uniref:MATH domain-containing protein n=1 Tax=Arachis hypogaea TaxID=3818 RepID=A0A445E5I9_ARAHY|nr:hypothetical protein Ahy_A02g004958 [Arachis hypogaea]
MKWRIKKQWWNNCEVHLDRQQLLWSELPGGYFYIQKEKMTLKFVGMQGIILLIFLITGTDMQVDGKMTKTDSLYEDFHKRHLPMIVMDMDKFSDQKNGFLVNDTCVVVAEVSLNNNVSFGRELIDFKGVAKIEKDYVELLEKACSKHPSLIESLLKRNI